MIIDQIYAKVVQTLPWTPPGAFLNADLFGDTSFYLKLLKKIP